MSKSKFLKKTIQRTKIARYRAYKRLGCLKQQHKIDGAIVLLFAVWLGIGGYFLIRPFRTPLEQQLIEQEQAYVNPDAQEQVHPDLGDDPVVADTGVTLADLKVRVEAGTAELHTYTLHKNETMSHLLNSAGITAQEGQDITDTLALLIDLKSLHPGETILIFTDKFCVFPFQYRQTTIVYTRVPIRPMLLFFHK